MSSSRLIESDQLLDLADGLIAESESDERTIDAQLRRAASTAYYAAFHRWARHAAWRLLGEHTWTENHTLVSRWVSHTDLLALASAVSGQGNVALRRVLEGSDPQLRGAAEDFIDLQATRHDADYNNGWEGSRRFVVSCVVVARGVVEVSDELYAEGEPSYQRFLGLALGGVKVAKSR
ncbi:MAG: hypothetical protein QM621_10880 [Aeromicrobium sp.]|uniref:hypothetical protein n=1 Tax=Aeromicrobium sp. TaxID=1871063 RepID=UPI0039E6B9D3